MCCGGVEVGGETLEVIVLLIGGGMDENGHEFVLVDEVVDICTVEGVGVSDEPRILEELGLYEGGSYD